jgi:hypothetical protein
MTGSHVIDETTLLGTGSPAIAVGAFHDTGGNDVATLTV